MSFGEILVTASIDVVNGNVTSAAALRADPGSDGVSLREALLAANAEQGPVTITWSLQSDETTITLESQLPTIARAGLTIAAPPRGDGTPKITIIGPPEGYVFLTYAGAFRVSGLRILKIKRGNMIRVRATPSVLEPRPSISDVVVTDCVFDNAGVIEDGGAAVVLELAPGSTGARLANAVIAHNRFSNFNSALMVGASGDDGVFQDILIEGNYFTNTRLAVEVGAGAGNLLSGLVIRRNEFRFNMTSLVIWASLTGLSHPTFIDGTLIDGNIFEGNSRASVSLQAGVDGAIGNVVSNTTIINNLFTANIGSGILVSAGEGSARDNLIENLLIANNTLVSSTTAIHVAANESGASRNRMTNVTIVNTIFANAEGTSGDGGGVDGDVDVIQVRSCLLGNPLLVGLNGNFNADPAFTDPAGDFRPRSDSPVIDSGEACGDHDLRGYRRPADGNGDGVVRCDLGAYELAWPTRRRAVRH